MMYIKLIGANVEYAPENITEQEALAQGYFILHDNPIMPECPNDAYLTQRYEYCDNIIYRRWVVEYPTEAEQMQAQLLYTALLTDTLLE